MTNLYLASKSPRRRELLAQLGVEFACLDISIPEIWDGEERPGDYVRRLSLEKARAGRGRTDKDNLVIAADTEVVIDGEILGKPENPDDALAMLEKLSGKTHRVYTAVTVAGGSERTLLNETLVTFRMVQPAECRHYVDSGEPLGKAGAYAIQGRAAAFITRLEGSYSGVMGLPLAETAELLNEKWKA